MAVNIDWSCKDSDLSHKTSALVTLEERVSPKKVSGEEEEKDSGGIERHPGVVAAGVAC